MDNGVVLISTGENYVRFAIETAKSIREHNPHTGTCLFADKPSLDWFSEDELQIFDTIGTVESPHYRSKVDYLPETPFDRTLYLDSDIRVVANIEDVFALLDRFDIALAHAHDRNREAVNVVWRKKIPVSFPQFNSGVMAYKKEDHVLSLLRKWRDAFHKEGLKKDQVTLRELLWDSDLRIATLPPEYNIRYKKYIKVWNKMEATPKVLHFPEFGGKRPNTRIERVKRSTKKYWNKLKGIVKESLTGLQRKGK